MKKLTAIIALSTCSIHALAFNDFAQDRLVNKTTITAGFSTLTSDTKYGNPAYENDSSNSDSTFVSATHLLEIDKDKNIGFGFAIDSSSSDGETEQSTVIAATLGKNNNDGHAAYSFTGVYAVGDSDQDDALLVSFSKQLNLSTDPKVDGEFSLGLTKTINPEDFSGGESLLLSADGRYKINDNFRIIVSGGLSLVRDFTFDSGLTYSVDPGMNVGFSVAYRLLKDVIVDLSYEREEFGGNIKQGVESVNVDTNYRVIGIDLDIKF